VIDNASWNDGEPTQRNSRDLPPASLSIGGPCFQEPAPPVLSGRATWDWPPIDKRKPLRNLPSLVASSASTRLRPLTHSAHRPLETKIFPLHGSWHFFCTTNFPQCAALASATVCCNFVPIQSSDVRRSLSTNYSLQMFRPDDHSNGAFDSSVGFSPACSDGGPAGFIYRHAQCERALASSCPVAFRHLTHRICTVHIQNTSGRPRHDYTQ